MRFNYCRDFSIELRDYIAPKGYGRNGYTMWYSIMYISIVPLRLWDSSQGGGVKAFGPFFDSGKPRTWDRWNSPGSTAEFCSGQLVSRKLKLILATCWTTFVLMSMLKSHCLVPKIAKLFFDISSINFKVYGADSQLNWSSTKLTGHATGDEKLFRPWCKL